MFELQVAPGITFVEGERRGRFPFGNCLVLGGRSGSAVWALVDTGVGDEVLEALVARGLPDVVINTHYHFDHVRGNRRLLSGGSAGKAAAGPEGAGGPDGVTGVGNPVFWCPAGEAEAFTRWEGFLRFTGFDLPGLEGARTVRQELGWVPTPVGREIRDGDELDLGGLRAVAVRLPGHTPGHTGLWFPAEGVIFAADIDLSGFGPWYGDVFSSIDDYLASLRRLETLVEETAAGGRRKVVILTSHRRPLSYEGFRERLPGFAARVDERDDRILGILAAADGPLSTTEVAERWPVYGPRAEKLPGIWKSEYLMVRHHLDRLARAGRIERLAGPPEPSGSAAHDRVLPGGNELWRVR